MKKLLFFFILIHGLCFSQDLEESIYVAAETFIANPNSANFILLSQQEWKFKTLAKTKSDQLALVFLQSHKGHYLLNNSKLKEAISTFEDAITRFDKHKLSKISDFDIIETCLIPLGNLYTKTNDYTNAENTIKRYSYLAKTQGKTQHEISGAINLAKLYYAIDRHETAIKLASEFINHPKLSTSQKQKLTGIKTESQIALANTLPSNNTLVSAPLEQTYKAALKIRDFPKALDLFQQYKDEQLTTKELYQRDLAQLYIEEAQVYYLNTNNNKALEALQNALKILIPNGKFKNLPSESLLYPENKFIDIFDLYSEIETNPETALKSYDLSFYVSDLLKKNWTTQETKILNQYKYRTRSEKCIDLLSLEYKKTKDQTLLVKALEYSESTKVFTLKEMFQKKQRLEKHPKDSLLIKEFNLLKKQEQVTNKLVIEHLEQNRASEITKLSKELSNISLELKSLETLISDKYSSLNNLISLEAIQQKLKQNNATLIEYFYGKHTIYQFIISNSRIELKEIETKKAENQITEYISLFNSPSGINNNIISYATKAHKLYKLLNIDAVSSTPNVIIIPDGWLNFVPFETLLSAETKTTSFAKMPFVINTQNICYNSSTYFYTLKNTPKNNNEVLGFFPVFNNSDKTLTYSVNESESIKDEMDSELFLNNHATKTNFLKKVSDYGILHLSTHASSGNFIKPSNIDFYDETLYLNELYSLKLNTNLVVLSACETGIGELKKAEGAMSISRGFQYAGVKNLLFSLWQINDLSTSQIMQSFYKNYSKSKSAFFANHQSKVDYLENKNISNTKKSPYYWGAFVYYGDISEPSSNLVFLYTIIITFIVFIILFLRNKVNSPKWIKHFKSFF
ncbi:CHAT domain-containing protein [Seonamhaeicola marinus]|uniref:CHAT domain-containing protein n=1 Tax=Seonamhaeicola marinus TaxID=1912246 RepID=A0A5D0HT25_9FLAO|nr:CHAT domain-containing protein [Seonamhaeicola marinus]TYA74494.1 CHAT domain-containing protein [Seonamhaeicola marinus]